MGIWFQGDLLYRPFARHAFGSADEVDAAVRAGRSCIVLYHDGLAFYTADDCRVHVAKLVGLAGLRAVGPEFILCIKAHPHLVCRHGVEVIHAVAAVDAHDLCNRAQSVSRVWIAVMATAEFEPPHIGIAFFLIELQPAEVVDVCPFAMHDLAKHPVAGHVEGIQFKEIITAVLEHHAMPLSFFGRIHQFPAFFKRGSSRDFSGCMFALLHGINRNGSMPKPGCAAVYKIHIVAFTQIHPVLITTGISHGLFTACIFQDLFTPAYPFR